MLNDLLTWVLDTVQALDPTLRVVLAGVAMLLETSAFVGLIVPGDAVVVLSATGVTSVWSGVVLALIVIAGALIGESIGYGLGRWFGPALQQSRFGRLLGDEQWDRGQRYVQRRGGPAIFLSRFIPVLHSTVPVIAGMSGFRYRTFLAWTAPACVLWASLYVTVGAVAASVFRDLSSTLSIAGYILVGAAVLFAASVFVTKRLLLRAERRHFEPSEERETGAGTVSIASARETDS
jgi:membrane protein DedA with SNARE-associated domain